MAPRDGHDESGDPGKAAAGSGKAGERESSKEADRSTRPESEMSTSAAPARTPAPAREAPRSGPHREGRDQGMPPDRALQDLWVARLRQGDAEALRDVIAAFGERITAVVSGILRDRDAVEDVVQESFTKAFYRIASFKGGSSLYTWLYRVAVNGAKDYIKSRRRRPAASFDDLPGRGALPASEAPLMEGLERRELRLRVRRAIAALPTRFRTVLALREIEGMTYNEIADVLGLSLGTVESRLFRARRRLRALLLRSAPSSPVDRRGPSS